MGLLAEVIRQPAFDGKPLEIFKGRVIEDLRRLADNPARLLAREFTRTLYTEAHPLGRPLTPAQAEAIQAEHLRDYYRRFFHPNNMMLAVVGDFRREEMAARIQTLFGDWPSSPLDLPAPPEVQPRFERGVYIIPRNLAQASLALGHFGINRFNPDRYAIELMDAILGGSGFSSRIMERIRTEEGLAYSVGTMFPTSTRDISLFWATAQTKNENVPRAVGAILEEIVVQLMTQEFNGYPADYLDTLLDRYRAVTVADVQRVAGEYLHPDASTILIIGDPTQFESGMRTFGPVHRLPVESPG
jgi:predicted Zn-dependent peptidase